MFGQHPWHPASASWPVKGWFFPCFSCYPVWSFREKPTRPESFHLHQCLGDFKSSRIQPTSKINWLTIWTFKKSCSDSERWFPVMQITWQNFLHEKSININHFCCHLRFFHSFFSPSGCIDPPRSLPHDPRCANASQLAAPHRCCRHLNNPGAGGKMTCIWNPP